MSRHTAMHGLDYEEELYDEDDYDDHVGSGPHGSLSPSVSQFYYNREQIQPLSLAVLMPKKKDKLSKCVDEVLNFVGADEFPRSHIEQVVESCNYNVEDTINALMDSEDVDNELQFDLEDEAPKPQIKPETNVGVPKGHNLPPVLPSSIGKVLADDNFDVSVSAQDKTSISKLNAHQKSDIKRFEFNEPSPDDRSRAVQRKQMKASHHSSTNSSTTESVVPVRKKMNSEEKESRPAAQTSKKRKDRVKVIKDAKLDQLKPNINMVVIGHVDAGKSTLMGHLLYLQGCVSQRDMHKFERESKQRGKASFAYAWVLDAHEEERDRGVTVDVGFNYFETKNRHVTLLDSPGHRDFIPNMITGAAQADVAVLVVDAINGEFESGFQPSGQTQEHAILVRSLGVTQMVVAINKMDAVDWSQERYDEIEAKLRRFLKKQKFKDKNVRFVPCSGLSGGNLVEPVQDGKLSWYTGETLLAHIDSFKPPSRDVEGPFRFSVSDVYKTQALGITASGKVGSGTVLIGDNVLILPLNLTAGVKGLAKNDSMCKVACAGDTVEIGLSGLEDPGILRVGQILCDVTDPVPLVQKFRAQIVVLVVKVPLLQGQDLILHVQCVDEPAKIVKLGRLIDKRTGEPSKKKTRCITSGQTCSVDILTTRPICIDTFKKAKQFGRFLLRRGGKTVAVGVVTKTLRNKKKS